jgi:hypothetical protein
MRAQATLQAPVQTVQSRRLKLQAMLCLPVRAGLDQCSMKVAVLGTTDYTRSSHGRMGWFLAVPKKETTKDEMGLKSGQLYILHRVCGQPALTRRLLPQVPLYYSLLTAIFPSLFPSLGDRSIFLSAHAIIPILACRFWRHNYFRTITNVDAAGLPVPIV